MHSTRSSNCVSMVCAGFAQGTGQSVDSDRSDEAVGRDDTTGAATGDEAHAVSQLVRLTSPRVTRILLRASNRKVNSLRIPASALLLWWLLSFAVPCKLLGQNDSKSATPPSQQSMGSRKDWTGLPNFGEVTPNLFRGGQPGVDGLESLKKMGVSIVVDMRSGPNNNEKRAVDKLGMRYVSIPWHCPFPTDEAFARFLKVVEDNPDKKVFVHCRLGDDRTGMAVAAYRMAEQGWSADQALDEMEKFGFDWRHHLICPTLQSYEKSFPDRLKKNEVFRDLKTVKVRK